MKPVLAMPLIHSGIIKGLIYLENSLVEVALAQSRLKILQLLSSQIVISFENAEFYKELEQAVVQRTTELVRVNQELQEANKKLEEISNIDGLTQISNHSFLDDFLQRNWKHHQRMQYHFSLILCDIDYFKQFNDIYGHVQGDKCLKLIAGAIQKAARRPGDLVARYGGEEFAVVLPETDLNGLKTIIKRIQENIRGSGDAPCRI